MDIKKLQGSGSLEKKVKKYFPGNYEQIISIPGDFTFKEKLFLYLNPDTNYKCKKCGNNTKLRRLSKGFETFCSPKCRGRISSFNKLSIIETSKVDVDKWPTDTDIEKCILNLNYSKSIIRKKYIKFYHFIETNYLGNTFNEKLFNWLKPEFRKICLNCGGKTLFYSKTFEYRRFCSKKCSNNYNKFSIVGGYNHTFFERYPENKSKKGYIYLINLFNETESFLKIGITIREMGVRKNEICGGFYNMNILRYEELTLYEAHLKEQLILTTITEKYKPHKKISGITECFTLDKKDIICSMI